MSPRHRTPPRPRPDTVSGHVGWIDAAKGIAVLSVVAMHASHWSAVAGAPTPGIDLAIALACVPLPVFFLVSGMLARSVGDPATPWRSVAKRIWALLWLYLLWQPVVLAYRVIGDAVVEGRSGVDWHGELVRLAATPLRPNGELWYLWALALHLVLVRATNRVPLRWLLPVAAAVFALWFGAGERVLGTHLWHVLGPGLQGLPMFFAWTLLGVRADRAVRRVAEGTRPWPGLLLVAGWQATAIVTQVAPDGARGALGVLQVVLGVPATILLARWVTTFLPCRALRDVGARSLPVYLAHTLVIVVLLGAALTTGATPLVVALPSATVLVLVALSTVVPLALERVVAGTPARLLFSAPQLAALTTTYEKR